MKKVWKLIAFIISRRAVANWLIRKAQKRPYKHIGQYMYRWWLIPKKYKVFNRTFTLPFAIRIHWIRRHDLDQNLHDHPFDFRAFVIKNYYVEEDIYGNFITRNVGDTYFRRAEEFHRIDSISHKGTWSLFILYKRRNEWGFMINNSDGYPRKIGRKLYESENQRGA